MARDYTRGIMRERSAAYSARNSRLVYIYTALAEWFSVSVTVMGSFGRLVHAEVDDGVFRVKCAGVYSLGVFRR